MKEMVKIKNISRKPYSLNLSDVTKGRVLLLQPETSVPVNLDEYAYLTTQCPGAFEKGFLAVVETADANIDIVESKNAMTMEQIEEMMSLSIPKLKAKLADVTCLALARDIYKTALEHEKSDKFVAEIEKKVTELAEGSILL